MHDYAPSKMSTSPQFRTVPSDPIAVQMHTLQNGLRLYLSVNKEEPRVYTEIAVRAGSKHDPADTTGLAHYFEHMMSKAPTGSARWIGYAKKPSLTRSNKPSRHTVPNQTP